MSSIGPIARVNTKVAAVNLDISRKLDWGKGLILEFLTVDRLQPSGWRVLTVRTKGFDRVTDKERTARDGSELIIKVADTTATLADVIRDADLHIRVDEQIYKVSNVPPVPPNVAQVYVLNCKIRTLKTTFTSPRR